MNTYCKALIVSALFTAGCTSNSVPGTDLTTSPSSVTSTKAVGAAKASMNGREIYVTSCAECHGANGEGTKKGISLIKGHALHHPSEDFINRVTNGKSDKMPAFKGKLTEAEIAEVVRYVREDIQGPYVKEQIK